MPITKERKEELVAQYNDILAEADGFVVLEYTRLPVFRAQELRRKLRDSAGQYVITKNTLFKIALEANGWPVPESLLKGTTSVAFGRGNFPGVAKEVLAYVNTVPDLLKITGGVMGKTVLSADQVEAVSNLPTLPEMRAQLAGLIVMPASGLVGVINAATADIVNVLQALVKKHEDGEAA